MAFVRCEAPGAELDIADGEELDGEVGADGERGESAA